MRPLHFVRLIALLLLALPGPALAQVLELGSPFSDGMVLQQQQTVNVWGWGEAGATVTVTVDGKSASATVGDTERWTLQLPALAAGGPFQMVVEDGTTQLTLSDVLVGEVYLAFGQSNMQYALASQTGSQAIIDQITAQNLPLRRLAVTQTVAFDEQERAEMEWQDTGHGGWSAVATTFAYYLHQATNVPVGIVQASWGSSTIEGWMPLALTEVLPHFAQRMAAFHDPNIKFTLVNNRYVRSTTPNEGTHAALLVQQMLDGTTPWEDIFIRTRPNILYNGMIHPLLPYSMRGRLWYQGESNGQNMVDAAQYRYSLRAWVPELSSRFQQEDQLFLLVELPRYRNEPWPWMRESQATALMHPHSGMAGTIDTGDLTDIHPSDKEPIGQRLALLAQRDGLGLPVEAEGPHFESMNVQAGQVTLRFSHAAGLKTSDAQAAVGFKLAGANQVWHDADTATINGDSVIVSSAQVPAPAAVRYAWEPFPNANLVNSAGLPMKAFRTDDWAWPDLEAMAPYTINDAFSISGTTVLTGNVLLNDFDLNHEPMTAVLEADAGSGTLELQASGEFSYEPAAGFVGVDTFTYRASDGALVGEVATVEVTVTAGEAPPEPGPEPQGGSAGVPQGGNAGLPQGGNTGIPTAPTAGGGQSSNPVEAPPAGSEASPTPAVGDELTTASAKSGGCHLSSSGGPRGSGGWVLLLLGVLLTRSRLRSRHPAAH